MGVPQPNPPTVRDEMVWREPPERKSAGGPHGRLGRFVAALRERPGEWALYPHFAGHRVAVTFNRKQYPGTEWTSRSRGDGTYELYGRWVGVAAGGVVGETEPADPKAET